MVGGFCAVDSERAVSVLDQLAFNTGHNGLYLWNLILQFILVLFHSIGYVFATELLLIHSCVFLVGGAAHESLLAGKIENLLP